MNSSPADDAACWFCLENEPDDDGKPLMRGCSCRGDAADWAHVSCRAGYACRSSDEAYIMYAMSDARFEAEAFCNEIRTPWINCDVCKQELIGDMLREMTCAWRDATKLLPESDARKIICALEHADAMNSGAVDIGPIVGELKNDLDIVQSGIVVPKEFASLLDGKIYQELMAIFRRQGDRERALFYAQNLLEYLPERNGEKPLLKEVIKSIYGECKGHEPMTHASLVCFIKSYEEKGEEHSLTIQCALQLARSSCDEGNTSRAFKIAREYAAIAKRVLGADHPITRKIEGFLIDDMSIYQNVTCEAKLTG